MSNSPQCDNPPLSRPLWPPPRAPLPPHRLAKLANALGVSTPLPAIHYLGRSTSPSPSYSFPDLSIRSQTPSAMSVHTSSSPMTSKYLLHVIPPVHLPNTSDIDESDLTPLPSSASGYHSQYQRGTLIPLHQNLQSQLFAIAKEYALPSTVGIVLYLVSSTPSRESAVVAPNSDASKLQWENEEPGPRLSDTVWKHIWARVLKVEKDDMIYLSPRTGTPDTTHPASLSSPSLLLSSTAPTHSTRPQISPQQLDTTISPTVAYPITPSPSTPSSAFDVGQSISKPFDRRSNSDPVESDVSPSLSSVFLDQNGEEFALPGLHSASLIPVLAKVEFDIDRRKASWYEPWLRSRRINHAKRAESRARGLSQSSETFIEGTERKAPIDLRLVGRLQAEETPEFLREHDDGYSLLGDEDEDDDEITAKFPPVPGDSDPLADVFGTDADTWDEMQADRSPELASNLKNPNIVDLVLKGSAVSQHDFKDVDDDEQEHMQDEHEVTKLWTEYSQPRLSMSTSSLSKARFSSPGFLNKRHVPPRLNLALAAPANGLVVPHGDMSPIPSSGDDSVSLAYLRRASSSDGDFTQVTESTVTLAESNVEEEIERYPSELGLDGKRGGAFFDDLDLGLQEFDENDPYDRRKSQYLMKAKLDEIEKALVQFSPQDLKSDFPESQDQNIRAYASSPRTPSTHLSPNGFLPSKSSPPSRKKNSSITAENDVWPAVPYSAIASIPMNSSRNSVDDTSFSSPKWTLNGVSAVLPKSPYIGKKRWSKNVSEVTKARKKHEAGNASYTTFRSPPSLDSPVIPLSPDPFGRYPSNVDNRYDSAPADMRSTNTFPVRVSSLGGANPIESASAPSSRFSADSAILEEEDTSQKRSSSLVSVKSIRKLWRKSNKGSISATPPLPNATLGKVSPQPQQTLQLPTSMELPPPRSPSISDFPPPTPPLPYLPTSRAASSAESSAEPRFDQESRYPIHHSSISQSSRSVTPLALTPRSSSPSVPSSHPPPIDKNGNVRKSILKSWKSSSGSITQNYDYMRSISDQSSGEFVPITTTRKRHPSIFESALMRGSVASLSELPPSPVLPDQFSNTLPPKAVKNNRTSMRPRPSPVASYSSTDLSSPLLTLASPITNPSPPRYGTTVSRRGSGDSNDGRSSFDNSQFEIVSPKLNQHGLQSSLSYPYHELDHHE